MLTHISWTQYAEALIVLLAIYYAFIGLKYYLPSLIARSNQKMVSADAFNELQYNPEPGSDEQDAVIQETDTLISELKQSLKKQAASEPVKAILKKYPDFKDSPLRSAINELIVTEWEKYSVVLLSEAEVNEWWE